MIKLEYSHNNSGGSWWLSDEDWKKLEAAGWTVEWYAQEGNKLGGMVRGDRFLGALASHASKNFESPLDGVREWEQITGENAGAEGCNCCGQPHSFSYVDSKGHTHFSSIETRSTFGGFD